MPKAISKNEKGSSLAYRALWPRAVGLGCGSLAVASVFLERDESLWVWGLLFWNAFIWPWMAYALSRNANSVLAVERRYVLFDSLTGGFWIGAMAYNTLPAVMFLAMLAMNNTAAGGVKMVLQGGGLQLLGMVLAALLGFGFAPYTSQMVIYACIPMLVIHPFTLGLVLYKLASQLSRHKTSLRTLSRIDSLTQLFNSGYWRELLQFEYERCHRGQMASVALIDIDHFKTTNDHYGHLIGDAVLAQVAERIRANLRAVDKSGRYGGDEFCILLPGLNAQQAWPVLERLRQDVEALRVEAEPDLKISLSIGIASFSTDYKNANDWLHAADQGLYAAKSRGRNCIVLADELTPAAEATWPRATRLELHPEDWRL